jgi:hypothetical protein
MEAILPRLKTSATAEQRRLAMDFVRQEAPNIQQLSLRTLIAVLRIIQARPRGWQQLAKFVITR